MRYHAVVPATLSDRDLFARLVGFDSTSHRSNRPIAQFLCDYLDHPSVRLVTIDQPDGEKVNVIAQIGPESTDGTGLALSGHLDVVPATEPEWASDPFELTERDGMLVGRGSCDMKGFVAIAVNAMLAQAGESLDAPLTLLLTADEELGSLGAKRLVDRREELPPLPGQALIGEPTSLGVVRMHKGHLTVRVTLRGKAAHSGSPHLGVNAIEPAWELLCGLAELRKHLEAQRTLPTSRFFPTVPFPVLNVARIRGGEALNVVPEACTVELGVRLLPGQESDGVRRMIEGIARGIDGDAHVDVNVINENPPMLTDEGATIHQRCCELLGQRDSRGVSYASDAGWLSRLGIDCVLCGPGSIEVAHRPNEFVPIDEWQRARWIVDQLIGMHCGSLQGDQRA